MKDTVTDANFPRTTDGRVYHLGLKHGELANRILTVGDPARAAVLAKSLEPAPGTEKIIRVESERGFHTFTGFYKGVRMSIVAIGMGFANMDFLVREGRECVDGDMYMIRFGSCGCLTDLPVGSIVVPRASVAVTRNYDFDFTAPVSDESVDAYRISKPAVADTRLHDILTDALTSSLPPSSDARVVGDCINASADSFYSSQGRITSFDDHNDFLLDHLLETIPGLTTLEMETFHLLHLAQSYTRPPLSESTKPEPAEHEHLRPPQPAVSRPPAPGISRSAPPTAAPSRSMTPSISGTTTPRIRNTQGGIYAASAQMVFASRVTANAFISPEGVKRTQEWGGGACLEALALA